MSHTTRPPRPGERDGVDYHFVSAAEFQRLIAAEAFLEWAVYNGNHYGTSWKAIEGPLADGLDVLLEIEVQGARQVRQRLPDARLIFLLPPSKAALVRRLEGRGTDTAEQVAARLRTAQQRAGGGRGVRLRGRQRRSRALRGERAGDRRRRARGSDGRAAAALHAARRPRRRLRGEAI